jgi:hypothetical protein
LHKCSEYKIRLRVNNRCFYLRAEARRFAAVASEDTPGVLSIEYAYHRENSSPEAGQRIGFVRRYGRVNEW